MVIPILIINWNGINDTVECIESVLKQDYTNYKIYLIDNGSDNNNAELLKQKYSNNEKIFLLFNQKNLGYTKAANNILKEYILTGNYKYVAFLNNDTVAENNWLSQLIKSAQVNKADMVSCKMINYHNRRLINTAGHTMLNTGEIIPVGNNESIDKFEKIFENFGPSGGACLYSTDMIRNIGMFDEYFSTGYEDAEYGVRAFVLGYKSIFEPASIVYHKVSVSIDKIRDFNYTVKIQSDILYTYFKLMPLPVILLNLPVIIIRYFIILFIFLIFFRLKYIKVFFNSLYIISVSDYKKIRNSRKNFFSQNSVISSIRIIKKQQFFLFDNIKRFYKYFIKGGKTIFEKYN